MVSVIVPTYNERENIAPLLKRISAFADQIVVVDDNSPDGTGQLARAFGGKVRTIIRPRKMGLNSAILCGVHEAKDRDVIVMDADFSHPPEMIPAMRIALKANYIVVASRNRVIGWGFRRYLTSEMAGLLAQALYFRWRVRDPMSGFFGIRRSIVEKYQDDVSPGGYKILFTILRNYVVEHGFEGIGNVNYTFINRRRGESKLSIRVIMDYLRSLLKR